MSFSLKITAPANQALTVKISSSNKGVNTFISITTGAPQHFSSPQSQQIRSMKAPLSSENQGFKKQIPAPVINREHFEVPAKRGDQAFDKFFAIADSSESSRLKQFMQLGELAQSNKSQEQELAMDMLYNLALHPDKKVSHEAREIMLNLSCHNKEAVSLPAKLALSKLADAGSGGKSNSYDSEVLVLSKQESQSKSNGMRERKKDAEKGLEYKQQAVELKEVKLKVPDEEEDELRIPLQNQKSDLNEDEIDGVNVVLEEDGSVSYNL